MEVLAPDKIASLRTASLIDSSVQVETRGSFKQTAYNDNSLKPTAVIASQSQHTDDEKFKMISPWITKREEII